MGSVGNAGAAAGASAGAATSGEGAPAVAPAAAGAPAAAASAAGGGGGAAADMGSIDGLFGGHSSNNAGQGGAGGGETFRRCNGSQKDYAKLCQAQHGRETDAFPSSTLREGRARARKELMMFSGRRKTPPVPTVPLLLSSVGSAASSWRRTPLSPRSSHSTSRPTRLTSCDRCASRRAAFCHAPFGCHPSTHGLARPWTPTSRSKARRARSATWRRSRARFRRIRRRGAPPVVSYTSAPSASPWSASVTCTDRADRATRQACAARSACARTRGT